MFAEISAAVSGLKTAYDVAKDIKDAAIDVAAKERTGELLDLLNSLRSQFFEVQTRMAELQDEKLQILRKIDALESWEETKANYLLKELAPGVFVYAYREMNVAEGKTAVPPHCLCTRCFESLRKSILQNAGYNNRGAILKCLECGAEFINHQDKPPSFGPITIQRRDPFPGF